MILQSPVPDMSRGEAVAYFALLTTAVGFTLAAVYGLAKLVAAKLKR